MSKFSRLILVVELLFFTAKGLCDATDKLDSSLFSESNDFPLGVFGSEENSDQDFIKIQNFLTWQASFYQGIVLDIDMESIDLWAMGGDTTIGNGGEVVFCSTSTNNSLKGWYTLDYLLSYRPIFQALANIVEGNEKQPDFLNSIEKRLWTFSKELGYSFSKFKNSLLMPPGSDAPYVWEKASFGLETLPEKELVKKLPINCSPGEKPLIKQAIVRQVADYSGYSFDKVLFHYDPEVLNSLDELQKSFLFVHEWLWNFTNNPNAVFRINALLHLSLIDDLGLGLWSELESLGLKPPRTNSKLFETKLCEAEDLSKDRITNSNYMTSYLKARVRLCSNGKGCKENWIDISDELSLFQSYAFYPIQSPAQSASFYFYPNDPSAAKLGRYDFVLNCSAESDLQSSYACQNDQTEADLIWWNQKQVLFSNVKWHGQLTNECLHLQSHRVIPIDSEYSWQVQLALFTN